MEQNNGIGPDPFANIDDADISIQKIAPKAGEKVSVAGVAGWYGAGAAPEKGDKAIGASTEGDTFATTSTDGYKVDGIDGEALKDSPGILATPFESGAARSRRLFGGRLDDETKLVRAERSDGGTSDVPRYYVVWKSDDKAIGMVGKVAAQRGKGDSVPAIVDPAPSMLQPSALDILDGLAGSSLWQGIDRGGCIGGSTPWLQARPIKARLPKGDDPEGGELLLVRPMVSNPLDGTGCLFFALPSEAVSCRNVYAGLLGSRRGVIKVRHCKSGEKALERLRKALEIVAESLPERLALIRKMATVSIDDAWMRDVFLPAVLGYSPGTTREDMGGKTRNRYDAVMGPQGFYRDAPGAEPGTAWGALQSVTYLTTHHWQGAKGATYGATPEQTFQGAAGAAEERAVAVVQRLALTKDERKVFAVATV